jgi:hypothetical protein
MKAGKDFKDHQFWHSNKRNSKLNSISSTLNSKHTTSMHRHLWQPRLSHFCIQRRSLRQRHMDMIHQVQHITAPTEIMISRCQNNKVNLDIIRQRTTDNLFSPPATNSPASNNTDNLNHSTLPLSPAPVRNSTQETSNEQNPQTQYFQTRLVNLADNVAHGDNIKLTPLEDTFLLYFQIIGGIRPDLSWEPWLHRLKQLHDWNTVVSGNSETNLKWNGQNIYLATTKDNSNSVN